MAETFRAPKAVRDEAVASGVTLPDFLGIANIYEIRDSSFGSSTLEWTNKIIASAEQRAVEIMEGNPTMAELRDGDALHGVMAADASIDAAQALLATIMDNDPIIAQAYYLICAADLALDPVIDALGLTDPDDDTEENSAADPATKMLDDDEDSEDAWIAHNANPETAEFLPDDSEEERVSSARVGEGTYVSWPTSTGRSRGRVEKVTARGTASSSDGYTMEATDDNPVFHVRVYKESGNGWVASDQVNVHRSNYLTIIKPLPSPRKADMTMVEERKTMIRTAERITMDAEIRAVDHEDANFKIAGYAATFNREATGLNFREVIAPGAFTRTLSEDNAVFLLINHDTEGIPLASTQSGTMRLSEDAQGLLMEADLDPQNPRAQELFSAIKRGDVNKMSFAFSVGADGQTKEDGLRTLTDLDLYEVSAVTWPAYDSTSIGARSAEAEAEDLELAKRKLALRFNQYSLRVKRKG